MPFCICQNNCPFKLQIRKLRCVRLWLQLHSSAAADEGGDANSRLREVTPLGSRRRIALLGARGTAPGDLEGLVLGVEDADECMSEPSEGVSEEGNGGEASLQGLLCESPVWDQISDKSIRGSPARESCSAPAAVMPLEDARRSGSSKVPRWRNSSV